jgi:hypothetical protein
VLKTTLLAITVVVYTTATGLSPVEGSNINANTAGQNGGDIYNILQLAWRSHHSWLNFYAENIASNYGGGGRSCTLITASPITPLPSAAPIAPEPVALVETKKPVSSPPPPACTNDCGLGDANRNNDCICECETGAVLIGDICITSIDRPGGEFDTASKTCTFQACAGLAGFIHVKGNDDGTQTCMTVDFGGTCDAACAEAKCSTSIFTAGEGDSRADPRICIL